MGVDDPETIKKTAELLYGPGWAGKLETTGYELAQILMAERDVYRAFLNACRKQAGLPQIVEVRQELDAVAGVMSVMLRLSLSL